MAYETDIRYQNLTTQLSRATPEFLATLSSDRLSTLRSLVSQLDANIRDEQRRCSGSKGKILLKNKFKVE